MKTLSMRHAERKTAGAAYASAARAYLDAWVELQARSLACNNAAVSDGTQVTQFTEQPSVLRHGDYLLDAIHAHLGERVNTRLAALLAE